MKYLTLWKNKQRYYICFSQDSWITFTPLSPLPPTIVTHTDMGMKQQLENKAKQKLKPFYLFSPLKHKASPWLSWSEICLQCGRPGLDPWVGKIPWRRERLPTTVFWPGEFHRLDSSWVCRVRQLSNFHFTLKASLNVSDIHLMSKQLHPEEETF